MQPIKSLEILRRTNALTQQKKTARKIAPPPPKNKENTNVSQVSQPPPPTCQPKRLKSEAWGPPQFQEKRSRSENAILGSCASEMLCPVLLFLGVFVSLVFLPGNLLCLFECFLLVLQGFFEDSRGEKNPWCFRGFPWCFRKNLQKSAEIYKKKLRTLLHLSLLVCLFYLSLNDGPFQYPKDPVILKNHTVIAIRYRGSTTL